MISGIDVSNHQGNVLWPAVQTAGFQFGIVKASEGDDYVDAFLARNFAGMRDNGLLRGAYHFARPEYNADPRADAQHFLDVVTPLLDVGDLVCLDIESGTGDLTNWVLGWMQHVEDHLGFLPILYTGEWWLDAHAPHRDGLAGYGLWLASWQLTPPPTPTPWDFYAFWQHGDAARVPGVTGDCDVDFFMGTLDRLPYYGKPATAPAENNYREVVVQALHDLGDVQAHLQGIV